MNTDEGALIYAAVLNGDGGGHEVDFPEIAGWRRSDGPLWIHLTREHPDTGRWLETESGLDPLACQALMAEETRPRAVPIDGGLLLILRGVNLNPGADPEDMVSIRLWIDAHRIISVRIRNLFAVADLRQAIAQGVGPRTTGEFLTQLTSRLVARMGPVILGQQEQLDDLEGDLTERHTPDVRHRISELRREAIGLRRFLAPQRDAMSRVLAERPEWFGEADRAIWREVADQLTRYLEDLDANRDRAAVTHEELMSLVSEQMNRTMYLLSVVAALFLPLGFLTGLLGVNVGGIPGSENTLGFLLLCGLLVVLGIAEVILFRRLRLF